MKYCTIQGMAIYAVIPLAGNFDKLNESVRSLFPNGDTNAFELPNKAGFLLNFAGTNQDLGKSLFITVGKLEGESSYVGSALILPFTSYWGRASTNMWDWIKVKLEGQT